jgi:hypothetical protein
MSEPGGMLFNGGNGEKQANVEEGAPWGFVDMVLSGGVQVNMAWTLTLNKLLHAPLQLILALAISARVMSAASFLPGSVITLRHV